MEVGPMQFLRCKISPGLFSGELAVRGVAFDGVEFSLFVGDEFVECDSTPITGQSRDGFLRVDVLAAEDELLLVRLPEQTFGNGHTVTVKKSQVQLLTPRERV
jgi:hypothetical protein